MRDDVLPNMDLSGLSKSDWIQRIGEIAELTGYFQPLGDDHFATFVDQGRVLLVTFEKIDTMRGMTDAAQPLGWPIARREGWSHLLLACDGDTWFRDPQVYGYFDRLCDDGFFEDFDRVVFYGAGACGYAAAAFSVAAPGATVILVNPQATLDAEVTGWDTRFVGQRRRNFTDRYGYAPDMIDAAEQAHVYFDPDVMLDAVHAALFARSNVHLHPWRAGADLQNSLIRSRQLDPILVAAARGELSRATLGRIGRSRREYRPYLRRLVARLEAAGHKDLDRIVCRNVISRMKAPAFQKRLQRLETPPVPVVEDGQSSQTGA